MNNIYRKGRCLLTAAAATVLLAACSSDDDSFNVPGAENFSREMIVGEWFEPAGEGLFGISYYKADGSITSTYVRASKKEWMYLTWSGYWEFSDGILTSVTDVNHSGLMSYNTKGVTKTIKLTKYEFEGSSLDAELLSGGYRIVDTYQMNVGETRMAIINDSEFVPQEYTSVSYHVASVNDDGTIEARHLGTTYIMIKSSIGTAVIRVVVNDNANDFNDALQSLGLSVQSITKEYGQIYIERTQEDGSTIRHYYLPDDKVMDIRMQMDADGYVNVVEQFFSLNITSDEVRESLNRKYDFLYSEDKGDGRIDWYTTSWQCRKVAIGYLENSHQTLMYFLDSENNLKQYDNFFSEIMNRKAPLWMVAYIFDYSLTPEDNANKSFITSAPYPFKYVMVYADDQGNVNRARLYFDDNITFQDVEYYIKRYYLPTSYPDLYVNSIYTYFLGYLEDEDGYLKYLQYDKMTTE